MECRIKVGTIDDIWSDGADNLEIPDLPEYSENVERLECSELRHRQFFGEARARTDSLVGKNIKGDVGIEISTPTLDGNTLTET